jgi:hypothetical protein
VTLDKVWKHNESLATKAPGFNVRIEAVATGLCSDAANDSPWTTAKAMSSPTTTVVTCVMARRRTAQVLTNVKGALKRAAKQAVATYRDEDSPFFLVIKGEPVVNSVPTTWRSFRTASRRRVSHIIHLGIVCILSKH